MRVIFWFVFLFSVNSYGQEDLPFRPGEKTTYSITFGGIEIGSASIEIVGEKQKHEHTVFHVVAKGKTAPFFDLFFKVRDVYETYMDIKNKRPVEFYRDIYEGGYKLKQNYIFKHEKEQVLVGDTFYNITQTTQDMLSALFFARTFKKNIALQGEPFFIPIFMDEENYILEVSYLYNEVLETEFGKINCMVFKPKMQEGRIFRDGEKMKIWISDDTNHLLLKVESKIWAGMLKAEILEAEGLKTPLICVNEQSRSTPKN